MVGVIERMNGWVCESFDSVYILGHGVFSAVGVCVAGATEKHATTSTHLSIVIGKCITIPQQDRYGTSLAEQRVSHPSIGYLYPSTLALAHQYVEAPTNNKPLPSSNP